MSSKSFTVRLAAESVAVLGDHETVSPRMNQILARYAFLMHNVDPRRSVSDDMLELLTAATRAGHLGFKMDPQAMRGAMEAALETNAQRALIEGLSHLEVIALMETIETEELDSN